MNKRKQKPPQKSTGAKAPAPPPRVATPRELGLKAFHTGSYGEAIRQWTRPGTEGDPALRAAVAEAYFRRALAPRSAASDTLDDLRHALDLQPDDARYRYHFALALHRADRLDEARPAYARTAEANPTRRGLDFVRGLAELEADPARSLGSLSWLSPEARAALAPISALLRSEPQAVAMPASPNDSSGVAGGTDPASALWRGLALFSQGDAAGARAALAPPKGQRLPIDAEATRAYYYGLATVMAGDPDAALILWKEAARTNAQANVGAPAEIATALPRLVQQSVARLVQEGRWKDALAELAPALAFAPANPWLLQAALIAENHLATTAREAGKWDEAVMYWQAMRQRLEVHPQLGALPPILHNIAIAEEAREDWEEAARAWVGLLNTLPRRRGRAAKKPLEPTNGIPLEEQVAWLRRRILDNFRRANLPDEAITYYKQAVKSDPDNLELRVELAQALLANEQTVAARNEVQRILGKDPDNIGALLLEAEIYRERDEYVAAERPLRRVLEIDPKHDMARRGMGHMLIQRGVQAFNFGQYRQAREIYTEALSYAPDDVQTIVFLAETEFALGNAKAGSERIEEALVTREPEAFGMVFDHWIKRQDLEAARKLYLRAEADGILTPELEQAFGLACFRSAPPATPFDVSARNAKKAKPNEFERWGRELLEKGMARSANRVAALERISQVLATTRPELAVEYIRQLIALQPDDPQHYFHLGLVQALSNDVTAARASLTRAEQLARKQGHSDLMEQILALREDIDSPMFRMFGPMAMRAAAAGFDLDDEDF
jgi:tetratricopeptide (TPR) repeat protein